MKLKEMIYKGLCNGSVKIIQNPNDDCIACEIGEYWFYFIGNEYENLTPDEVYETFTKDELTEMILEAIKDLDETEIGYYKAYLAEQFETLKRDMETLEDILQELGSEEPFLDEVIINEDGSRQPFTKSGDKAYGKLTEILYAVGELTNTNVNDIVEELDSIANQEF